MGYRVPRHEPEVVKAFAAKRPGGDDEKVPTTSISSLVVRGVTLLSRYDKAHEFNRMADAIEAVPDAIAQMIESLWCDSKACATYTVKLRVRDEPDAKIVARVLDRAFFGVAGGHNGIWVDDHEAYADSNWDE